MRKHLKYLSYVLRHKWFVFQECWRLGLFWQGITHDLSKFSPAEWGPYVDKFYGGPWDADRYGDPRNLFGDKYTQGWVDRRFDAAWLHHQHHNPHHWQHWVLREDSGAIKCLEMPHKYLVEMIADWWGAGRAINGKSNSLDHYAELRTWYQKNRDKIQLSEHTRELVEQRIGYFHFEPGKTYTISGSGHLA